MTNHVRTFGQAAVDNGFHILPVAANDKFPATFTSGTWKPEPDWVRWGKRAPTAIELKSWTSWASCSVGIPCGNAVGFDLDILDPEIAAQARAIVLEELGPALERVGRRPKVLLLYRTKTPFPGWRARPLPVEILGLGQQFVAAGTHPAGHDYVWLGDSPADTDFESLTAVTEEQVRRCCGRLLRELPPSCHVAKPATGLDSATPGQHNGSSLGAKANPEAIEDALRHIPNNDLAWDDWTRVGLAVKAAIGDEGKPLFEAWSAQAGKNDPKATAKAWKGFKPNGTLGAGSIFAMARSNGWEPDPDLDFTAEDEDLPKIDLKALIENSERKKAAKIEVAAAEPEGKDESRIYASTGSEKIDALIGDIIANATPMLKEIAAFHASCMSGAPVPIFSMGTAIMAVSVAMSRTHLSPTNSTPSVGQVQIAESGGGKEAAMDAIKRLFGAANMNTFLGSGSPKSEGAILKDLKRHPVILYGMDEFGDQMRKHDPIKNPYGMGAIIKTLVGSTDKGRWNGASYAGEREEIIIESPVLSILGTTTPDQLFSALTAGSSKDGFLPRFLYLPFQYPPEDVEFRLTPIPDPDPAIVAFLRQIARMGSIPGNLAEDSPHKFNVPPAPPKVFSWGSGGKDAYIDIKRAEVAALSVVHGSGAVDIDGARSLENRRAQRAQQFAMMRSIADGRTDIRAEDMAWGSNLWSLGIKTFLRGRAHAVDVSPWGESVQRLLATVRRVRGEITAFLEGRGPDLHEVKLKGRNPPVAKRLAVVLVKDGWVPVSAMRRAYNGTADFDKVMKHVVDAELVVFSGSKKGDLRTIAGDILADGEWNAMKGPPQFYRLP